MKSKLPVYALLFLLLPACKAPQQSTGNKAAVSLDKPLHTQNSLLWQISGNGLNKPSYLYGTIHIIGENDYFLGKNVKRKLLNSDLLVMELDPSKIDVAALTAVSVLDSNKTIKQYMSDSDYATLRAFMEDSIGIKRYTFEQAYSRFKPFYLEQLIFFRYLGQDKESYEENFRRMAEDKSIPVSGLETFEEQLRFLDENTPLDAQLREIVRTIKNYGAETAKLDQLVRYYKAQDINAITKDFEEEDHDLIDKLVDKRNQNWIPKLRSLMQVKSCFIAVGAGHLGGGNGLIRLLQKQGYTVDPVSIDN